MLQYKCSDRFIYEFLTNFGITIVSLVRIEQKRINFELNPHDLLLIFRQRSENPIVSIYYNNENTSEPPLSHVRKYTTERLVMAPALILHPFISIYGKKFSQIQYREDLSFGLKKDITELIIGKNAILERLATLDGFKEYVDFFSHLPEQAPYDPHQFKF